MFRFENNVPNIYANESRDFQLLCRLCDLALCDSKSYIDRLIRIIDTEYCSTNLIKLLQTRLGFLTLGNYSDETIRGILLGFSDILKYKGSRKAIKQAIDLFLKLNNINTKIYINISNLNDLTGNPNTINIGIQYKKLDTSILDELFRYILPTGYIVEYTYFDTEIILGPSDLKLNNYLIGNIVFVSNNINSLVRKNNEGYLTYSDRLIGTVGETQIIESDNNSNT